MVPRKKQSDSERLKKKREAEKKRQEKIKQDPERLKQEKIKQHEKYLKKLQKGQRKLIGAQSDREKRKTRKKWRDATNKARQKKKDAEEEACFLSNNSPPLSENGSPLPAEPLKPDARRTSGRKRIKRNKTKTYRDLQEFKLKYKKSRQKAERYKKRYMRLLASKDKENKNATPRTKVKQLLKGTTVSGLVRRKLVFGELVQQEISKTYKNTSNTRDKIVIRNIFNPNNLRKYKVKKSVERLVGVSKAKYNINYKTLQLNIATDVKNFLQRDEFSRLCPGKKDTITVKKDKRQKRFLNKSLKEIHSEFLKEVNYKLSYSLFCRLRPFWVLDPKVENRNTCLCKKCSNMSMLVSKLNAIKVIDEECPEKLVNSLCCTEKTVECLFRECVNCQDNIILYNEFSVNDSTSYNKWIDENVEIIIKGNKKQVKKATKKTFTCTIEDLIEEMEKNIINYMSHCGRIKGQFKAIQEKKENLQQDEIMIHIDFSENYCGKFSEEIQSVHFGGSRSQITLHTGVMYVKDQKPISFCTISESKEHGSAAIWAHLKPVLHYVQAQFTQVNKIHFLSDSPSGQYRNKTMFHLTQTFLPKIFVGLECCSWNFSEAGHGKGAPDGVGGFIKRTADKCIAQGSDIMNIDDLLATLKEKCQKIVIWRINQEEITAVEKIIEGAGTLSPIPGTLKIHQISFNKRTIDYRTMTCWKCEAGVKCTHYSLKIKNNIKQIVPTEKALEVGDWVIVSYEGKNYPGEIVGLLEQDRVKVNAMEPSGPGGWKWPSKPDVHSYPKQDILKLITAPVPSGSRASQFIFYEQI